MRAVSTVLDVSLCLLFVAASATTLAGIPSDSFGGPSTDAATAESVAELVATNTATVSYALGETRDRHVTTHDTLAGLLATAAVADSEVTAESESVAFFPATEEFRRNATRAVARGVRRVPGNQNARVQVVAEWEPYHGAAIRGRVVAGPRPPPNADVHAATFTAPSGFQAARADALSAARRDGYGGVARVLATALVAGWFPANETSLDDATVARYRRVAAAYDTSVDGALSVDAAETSLDVSQANRNLVRAIAADVEPRLEARFDTPNEAARAVSLSRVRITVRTWSR